MPRSRRSAAVAVLVLLGALALTGCGKAQPGAAAYVGDTRYTERQLDDVIEELRQARPTAEISEAARGLALSRLIIRDLGRRVAQAKGIRVPDIPAAAYDEYAQREHLPANLTVVRLGAECEALAEALAAVVQPVAPTDEDVRVIWEALRNDPRLPPGVTYDVVADVLGSDPQFPLLLGVRNALRDQANKTKVLVNPVYRPLVGTVATSTSEAAVIVLLAEDAGLVADSTSG